MHHKKYEHPTPYTPEHDYKHDMKEIAKHICNLIHGGYHKGEEVGYLGMAASLHDHVTDLHYGEGQMVKKELKRVIDYLYMYAETCHEIYHFLAEDALKHVEQLQADIEDEDEKEHVQYFLNSVKEYMSWLKTEATKKYPEPIHTGMGMPGMPGQMPPH